MCAGELGPDLRPILYRIKWVFFPVHGTLDRDIILVHQSGMEAVRSGACPLLTAVLASWGRAIVAIFVPLPNRMSRSGVIVYHILMRIWLGVL